MTLHVQTLTVGPLQSNCHIAYNAETREAIVVDPGDDAEVILDFLAGENLRTSAIWLTHAHIDHIGACAAVKRATGAPVTIHPLERAWLSDGDLCLASWIGIQLDPVEADYEWHPGEEFEALGVQWRTMHVPGHSPGLVAIYSLEENIAFSGDLIFQGSMGRVDLPNGNPVAMTDSLERFLELPSELRLYVGHGPDTMLGAERQTNQVVKSFMGRL